MALVIHANEVIRENVGWLKVGVSVGLAVVALCVVALFTKPRA